MEKYTEVGRGGLLFTVNALKYKSFGYSLQGNNKIYITVVKIG